MPTFEKTKGVSSMTARIYIIELLQELTIGLKLLNMLIGQNK